VSQPVDLAILAQVQATISAPENCQPPAHASSETALSGKVDKPEVSGKMNNPAVSGKVDDYGPMRDFWLRYSFVKGLEKKKNSLSTTSSQHHASHEGTGANVQGPHDKSGAHPGAQLASPVQSVGDKVVQDTVAASEVGRCNGSGSQLQSFLWFWRCSCWEI